MEKKKINWHNREYYLFYDKYDNECFEIFIEKQRRVIMLNDLWIKTLHRLS